MEPSCTPCSLCQLFDERNVTQAFGEIPLNVQRQGRARAGKGVYLSGVTKLVFDGNGSGRLSKLQNSARVGKSQEGSSILNLSRARKITPSTLSIIVRPFPKVSAPRAAQDRNA